MSDLRKTCDFSDRHGVPIDKRFSMEWMFYFHMCAKCLKQWDETHEKEAETC